MDNSYHTKTVTSDQLKRAIENKEINVLNLKLTSDRRLVETSSEKTLQALNLYEERIKNKLNNMRAKANLLGANMAYVIQHSELAPIGPQLVAHGWISTSGIILYNNNHTSYNLSKGRSIVDEYPEYSIFVDDMTQLFSGVEVNENTLKKLDTRNVTTMKEMFLNCTNRELYLSNFNTSNVTDMTAMFKSCKVKYLNITNFNTSNVTDMTSMFENCMNIDGLDLSSFNTDNVKSMRSMFSNCSNLSSLSLKNFTSRSLEYVSKMFWHCNKLMDIYANHFCLRKYNWQVQSGDIKELLFGEIEIHEQHFEILY